MTTRFRIRHGTYDAADMTSTYDVESWPVQTDQGIYKWWVASPSEMWREYDAIITDALDGGHGAVGSWNGAWYLAVNTPLMLQYARATIFPTDGFNEAVTVVTYTAKYGWKCIHCTAHYNEPADSAEPKPRGKAVLNWRIDFDEGTEADSGGGFSVGFSSGFNIGGIPA